MRYPPILSISYKHSPSTAVAPHIQAWLSLSRQDRRLCRSLVLTPFSSSPSVPVQQLGSPRQAQGPGCWAQMAFILLNPAPFSIIPRTSQHWPHGSEHFFKYLTDQQPTCGILGFRENQIISLDVKQPQCSDAEAEINPDFRASYPVPRQWFLCYPLLMVSVWTSCSVTQLGTPHCSRSAEVQYQLLILTLLSPYSWYALSPHTYTSPSPSLFPDLMNINWERDSPSFVHWHGYLPVTHAKRLAMEQKSNLWDLTIGFFSSAVAIIWVSLL